MLSVHMAAKKGPPPKRPVFTRDEMSTGKGSRLRSKVSSVISPPGTGSFPVLKVNPVAPPNAAAVRDEIRYRERQATAAIVGPVLAKPKPAAADTFAKQKMKEAEANLPDWDVDDEIYPDDDVAPGSDPDRTDPGED
jgi:hypothetical protein